MKTKKPSIDIPDNETLATLAAEALRLDTSLQRADADLTVRLIAVKEEHQALTKADRERHAALVKAIEKHVQRRRDSLMGDAKHVDLPGGIRIGFRLAPWSVEKLDDSDTWDEIVDEIDGVPGWEQFLKKTTVLNKAALLAQRENLLERDMTAMGIMFAQAENLYMEALA